MEIGKANEVDDEKVETLGEKVQNMTLRLKEDAA